MPRFFIGNENVVGEKVVISGEDANHISRSLRMKVGEAFTACDFDNIEYSCEIESITAKTVTARIISRAPSDSEPKIKIKLFFALLKSDKNELVVQKAVELGASEIYLYISENCVSRPDEKSAENKIARLSRIALEAAKQCGRARVPTVCGIYRFEDIFSFMNENEAKIFCYERERERTLYDTLYENRMKNVSFIIGPEGGFSPDEVRIAALNNAESVSLGKRILRAETAPIYALSCAIFINE